MSPMSVTVTSLLSFDVVSLLFSLILLPQLHITLLSFVNEHMICMSAGTWSDQ